MHRKTICLALIIVVSVLLCNVDAGVTNPEDFEGYATGSWSPTEQGRGWTLDDRDPMNPRIVAGASYNGSQALHLTAPDAGDGGGMWYLFCCGSA